MGDDARLSTLQTSNPLQESQRARIKTARELLDVVGVPPPGLSAQRDGKQLTCSIRITEMGDPGSMQLLGARDSGVCGGGRYRGLSLRLVLLLDDVGQGSRSSKKVAPKQSEAQ